MFLLLFLIWVIFNGRVTLEIVLFGVGVAAVVFLFMCKFMDYSIKKDIAYSKCFFMFLGYCFILIVEIIKANIIAIHYLTTNKYELEPVIVSFKAPLTTKVGQVLLANSITLTPGTITVDLEDDIYYVHCLDKELAAGLNSSIFVEYLLKMEKYGKEAM